LPGRCIAPAPNIAFSFRNDMIILKKIQMDQRKIAQCGLVYGLVLAGLSGCSSIGSMLSQLSNRQITCKNQPLGWFFYV